VTDNIKPTIDLVKVDVKLNINVRKYKIRREKKLNFKSD
jgi:hypothetical protein